MEWLWDLLYKNMNKAFLIFKLGFFESSNIFFEIWYGLAMKLNQRQQDALLALQVLCAKNSDKDFGGWEVLDQMQSLFQGRYTKCGRHAEGAVSRTLGVLYKHNLVIRNRYYYGNARSQTFFCYKML